MKKDEAISLLYKISRKIGLPETSNGIIECNIITRIEDLVAAENRAADLYDELMELKAQIKEKN